VFNITTEGNTFTSNTANYSIPSGITLHVSCVLQDYQAAPAPTPSPPPAAVEKVLMSYYPSYTNTNLLTALPSRYTHVVIFRMIPGTSGYSNNNGKGTATAGYHRFEDGWNVTQAQVQAVRALGQKVLVSIGGAGTGYYFDTAAEVTNFVASFQTFYASHGPFDGIDYNNYESGIMPETASNAYVDAFVTRINQISTQLRALYGSDFIISTPPNPNSAADWRIVETMDDAGLITFACPQYYDWSGFAATDFIKVRNRNWVDGVFDGDESKVVLGLPANYTGGGGPTLTQSLAEWDKCVSEYPNMRGVFGWNMHTTLANGDAFGSAFATRLGI
jgi:chitinase